MPAGDIAHGAKELIMARPPETNFFQYRNVRYFVSNIASQPANFTRNNHSKIPLDIPRRTASDRWAGGLFYDIGTVDVSM